jgi:hypothetical protein
MAIITSAVKTKGKENKMIITNNHSKNIRVNPAVTTGIRYITGPNELLNPVGNLKTITSVKTPTIAAIIIKVI